MALKEIPKAATLSTEIGAVLATKTLPRFTYEDMISTVNELLYGTGAKAMLEPALTRLDEEADSIRVWNRAKGPPRVGLSVNGITLIIEGFDRPAFDAKELNMLDTRSWPDGKNRLGQARSHVDITEIRSGLGKGLDYNYDRATTVTVVAAAVARLADTIGVVWRSSNCALPSVRLPAALAALGRDEAPTALWIGRPDPTVAAGKGSLIVTRGFYSLIGAEIEVVASDMSADAAFDVAMEVASEILRAGEPPGQGERLEVAKDFEFTVGWRANDGVRTAPKLILTRVAHSHFNRYRAGVA